MLRPYLRLAEKLGSLAAQLAPAQPAEVSIQATASAERELKALGTAVLRGLLDQLIDLDRATASLRERADHRARRGIRVIQAPAQASDYANAITWR